MMLRLVLLALALIIPTASLADAKMEHLLLAARGAAACQQGMPSTKDTTAALKKAGFQTLASDGYFKAFGDPGRKVIVMLTTEQNGRRACIVTASEMSVVQARALIEPWLQEAKPKLEGGGQRPFAMGWIGGTFKGGPIELLIGEPRNTIFLRGATIIARTPV